MAPARARSDCPLPIECIPPADIRGPDIYGVLPEVGRRHAGTKRTQSTLSSIFLGRIVGVMFMRVKLMCAHRCAHHSAGYNRPRLVSPWRISGLRNEDVRQRSPHTSTIPCRAVQPRRDSQPNNRRFWRGSLQGSDRSSLTCIHYITRPSEKTDYRET